MLTQTTETLEFYVSLNDNSIDEDGIGMDDYRVAVAWDKGVTPDWQDWLERYRKADGNHDWEITSIKPLTLEFGEF